MLKALMSDWADFKDKNMRKKTPKPRNSCGGESFRSAALFITWLILFG
jgi:hypothetical protein